MKNISDNNWDDLGSKIAEYTPDEFIATDWEAMEGMLNPPLSTLAIITAWLKGYASLIMSALALSIATFVMVTSLSNKETTENISTTSTAIEVNSELQNDHAKQTTATSSLTNVKENQSTIANVSINTTEQSEEKIASNPNTTINNLSASANESNQISNTKSANTNVINESKTNRKIPSGYYKKSTDENTKVQNQNILYDTASVKNENTNLIFAQSGSRFNSNNGIQNAESKSVDRNSSIGKSIPSLGLSTIEFPDVEFSAPPSNKVIAHVLDKRLRFGVQFGLNNSITDYSDLTASHLPFVGIYAKKRLSQKWEAEVAAQIKWVKNYDLELFFRQVTFDQNGTLGSTEFRSTHNGYQSFDFPVTLNYKINNSIWLVQGLRYSYIKERSFGGLGSVSVSGSPASPVNNVKDFVENNELFDRKFWRHDLGVVVGTKFQINQKLAFQIMLNFGLRDITPDNLYVSDTRTHLNSDLQFSAKYTF